MDESQNKKLPTWIEEQNTFWTLHPFGIVDQVQ